MGFGARIFGAGGGGGEQRGSLFGDMTAALLRKARARQAEARGPQPPANGAAQKSANLAAAKVAADRARRGSVLGGAAPVGKPAGRSILGV